MLLTVGAIVFMADGCGAPIAGLNPQQWLQSPGDGRKRACFGGEVLKSALALKGKLALFT